MFSLIGKITYRWRWLVLVIGLAFITTSAIFGLNVASSLKVGGFTDPNGESTKAAEAAHKYLGVDEGTLVVLFTSKNGLTYDNPAFAQSVESILAKINGQPGVGHVYTYYNTGLAQFISNDHRSTYAIVGLPGDDDAHVRGAQRLRPLLTGTDILEVQLGGRAAVNEEIVAQADKDLQKAEMLTFPIVAILMFLIFRSAIASMLPLLVGGTAILGAFLILRIVSNFAGISVFALNIITMLGLGLAIDYSLFVVSRYREELGNNNGDVQAALIRTMQTAGHTVMFSGLTVIISLLSLLVFNPAFLKSMGFGGAMAVLVAMVSALTILPAVLAVLGHRINWLSIHSFIPGRKGVSPVARSEQKGYWYRSSQFVMNHPVLVLVATLVPLLLIGVPFLRINFSTFDARTLPDTHEGRRVSEILDSQFPPNETAPIELVVRSDAPALDKPSLDSLYDYTRRLQTLPGVKRVDSLVTLDPRLDKAGYEAFYSGANLAQNQQAVQAVKRFSNGNYSMVSIIYTDDQYSTATQELVRTIRKLDAPSNLNVQVSGNTALLVDLLKTLGDSVPLAFSLIVIVLFVLLFLMLGSVVVPLKAVILNILSLSACFGTLVLIFQDGNFANLLNFTSTGSIDSTQPVLIFAGAFGLSLDYEVFLLSRIKEHYDLTKDLRGAVALGVQKTGGIITSAALLLVVVIASFVTGEVLFIKQIGVGLAVAILVDATLVRTLLLPATMRLMGKYNWWAPAPLVWVYERLGLGETSHAPAPAPVVAAQPARMAPVASVPQPAPANTFQKEAAISMKMPDLPGVPAPLPASKPGTNGNSFRLDTGQIPVPDPVTLQNILIGELGKQTSKQSGSEMVVRLLNQLGDLCRSMGQEKEALEYYKRCLKAMHESGFEEQSQVIILVEISNLYAEMQDSAKGLPITQNGLRMSRMTGQFAAEFTFMSNLAEFYLINGDVRLARASAEEARHIAQRRQDSARVRKAEQTLERIDNLLEKDAASQRKAELQKQVDTEKQSLEFFERAKQLQNERAMPQAIEMYGKALALNPRLFKAYVNRAIAYNSIREYQLALADYNKALSIQNNDADVLFNRGNVYFNLKDYLRALHDYEEAIYFNPADPDYYFNRGETYRKLGLNSHAAADFRKVLELSQGQDQWGARQATRILAELNATVKQ